MADIFDRLDSEKSGDVFDRLSAVDSKPKDIFDRISQTEEVKEEPSKKEFKKDSEDIFITSIIKELITQNKIGTDEVLDSDFHSSLREAWRNGR